MVPFFASCSVMYAWRCAPKTSTGTGSDHATEAFNVAIILRAGVGSDGCVRCIEEKEDEGEQDVLQQTSA